MSEKARQLLALHAARKLKVEAESLKLLLDEVDPEFDDMTFTWNSDNSLNKLTAYSKGRRLYTLHFVWQADGSLASISRA